MQSQRKLAGSIPTTSKKQKQDPVHNAHQVDQHQRQAMAGRSERQHHNKHSGFNSQCPHAGHNTGPMHLNQRHAAILTLTRRAPQQQQNGSGCPFQAGVCPKCCDSLALLHCCPSSAEAPCNAVVPVIESMLVRSHTGYTRSGQASRTIVCTFDTP